MKKNILKILLLVLLVAPFINSASAFGIKQSEKKVYECYFLVDAPEDDPDCIDFDPETGLREEGECLTESNSKTIYGDDELKAFVNSLTDTSRYGCRRLK